MSNDGDTEKHSATPILIGLGIGLVLGLIANFVGVAGRETPASWVATAVAVAQPAGRIFLRLMMMVVVPMVVAALALSVVEIGDVRKLGRMGLRTLVFTGIFSTAAVLIGMGLVNLFQPGNRLPAETRDRLIALYSTPKAAGDAKESAQQKQLKAIEANAEKKKSIGEVLVDMIPENPLQEMVGAVDGSSKGNGMLAVMVFSLIMGLAITLRMDDCRPLIGVLQSILVVTTVIIEFALKLAPLGAGCLVFAITAQLGFEIVRTLAWFAGTVVLGLSLQLFVTYSFVIWTFGGMSPWRFFHDAAEAMITAFSTSSSNATLPTAIRVAEDDLKLPPAVSRFVLTVGATGNQNGTALYEGVVILFLAQVMGVELNFAQQLQVVLMSILAGIGTAGVPGGSIPLIVVVMKSVGIPGESIGIILGVDRLLDMCRTVVNVMGDLAVATCVAKSESAAAAHEEVTSP
ncbi:MAG TPA: dicarboxylate/amino acid:cation symporter [Planctomycetaceae bacterium]|nr:dicarboxylate/amino acid:cation symporter [Planctomycetaceae bacterium]